MDLLLFCLIIFIAHMIGTLTGFGNTILALPFCTALLGIDTAVPTLIMLSFFFSATLVLLNLKYLNIKFYLKMMAVLLIGWLFGVFTSVTFSSALLKIILSWLLILLGSIKFYTSTRKHTQNTSDKKRRNQMAKIWSVLLLSIGGVVQGVFGVGGPFVAVYANQQIEDKKILRTTLCALWASLNGLNVIRYMPDLIDTIHRYKHCLSSVHLSYSLPFL